MKLINISIVTTRMVFFDWKKPVIEQVGELEKDERYVFMNDGYDSIDKNPQSGQILIQSRHDLMVNENNIEMIYSTTEPTIESHNFGGTIVEFTDKLQEMFKFAENAVRGSITFQTDQKSMSYSIANTKFEKIDPTDVKL